MHQNSIFPVIGRCGSRGRQKELPLRVARAIGDGSSVRYDDFRTIQITTSNVKGFPRGRYGPEFGVSRMGGWDHTLTHPRSFPLDQVLDVSVA